MTFYKYFDILFHKYLDIYDSYSTISFGGCPSDRVTKDLYYNLKVYRFQLQSRCYIHFYNNTLEKAMNPHTP